MHFNHSHDDRRLLGFICSSRVLLGLSIESVKVSSKKRVSVILLKSHMLNKIRNKHVEEDGGWWMMVGIYRLAKILDLLLMLHTVQCINLHSHQFIYFTTE